LPSLAGGEALISIGSGFGVHVKGITADVAKEALGNELSRRASSLDLSLINILIADRA
jgi:hypothetical protein